MTLQQKRKRLAEIREQMAALGEERRRLKAECVELVNQEHSEHAVRQALAKLPKAVRDRL